MGWKFSLNAVRAIGGETWATPCNWAMFNYHEVAWLGGCTAKDGLYDACLEVDGPDHFPNLPRIPLLPRNMPFGEPGDGFYRDRLASPTGRRECNPQPTTRCRRTVE